MCAYHVCTRGQTDCTRGPNGFLQQVACRSVNLITVGSGKDGRLGDKCTPKGNADDHVMTVKPVANDNTRYNNLNKDIGRTPTLLQLLS